jgi:hypothetical protein
LFSGNSRNPWLNPGDSSNPSTRSPSPAPTPPAPSRSPSASPQPYASASPSPAPSPYLFPQVPRTRSKSDTALEPPNWDNMGGFINAQQQLNQPPTQSQSPPMQQARQVDYPGAGALNANFTFGQPPSSSTSNHVPNADSNGFLSPDLNTLRRSKSDSGGRGAAAHHRTSRSEDIHPGLYDPNGGAGLGLGLAQTGQYLFPPSSHQEFLQSTQQQQFLSPNMSSAGSAGSGRGGMRVPELSHHQHSQSLSGVSGHYRRASSGTRSERGTSWDRGDVIPASNRASPYPTPKTSPRMRYNELQHDEFDLIGQGQGQSIVSVSKPNVTTGRTANASHKRRKQEATFVCPVQGCGSTFTRSFNLKGVYRVSYQDV